MTQPGVAPLSHQAHLNLISAAGAGLYIGMLRRWLCMPFAEMDVECLHCDGILDSYGDHALCCSGGGDRTRRHNLLRNLAYHAAAAANLNPELEKPGLLPHRPLHGANYENGTSYSEENSGPGPGDLLTCTSLDGAQVRQRPGILR